MAVNSIVVEFVDSTDASRAWRKKEVSELVQALGGTTAGSQLNETLRRSLAMLLNAHWEGLVKEVIDQYVRAAARLGAAEGLSEGIAFVALASERIYSEAEAREKKRLFGRLKEPHPVSHPIADVLLAFEYERGHLWDRMPDEMSTRVGHSLWWNRFEHLCGLVDLPIAHDAGDQTIINSRVVGLRHEIAHGKATLPDEEELLEARDRVFALLDGLVDESQGSLEARRFAGAP